MDHGSSRSSAVLTVAVSTWLLKKVDQSTPWCWASRPEWDIEKTGIENYEEIGFVSNPNIGFGRNSKADVLQVTSCACLMACGCRSCTEVGDCLQCLLSIARIGYDDSCEGTSASHMLPCVFGPLTCAAHAPSPGESR